MKFNIVIFFSLFFLLSASAGYAQSKQKAKKNKSKSTGTQRSTSLEPYYPQKDYAPKASRGKSQSFVVYDAEKRYYERLEEIAKQKRKIEKEMMKPQYSDPTYFGHKRPPKKRKPGKMKYCKECGLRH